MVKMMATCLSQLFSCPCISVNSKETKANFKSNEIQNYLRWWWMTVTCPTLFPARWRKQSSGGDALNSLTSLLFGLFYWTQVGSTANEIEKEFFGGQVKTQVCFFSLLPLFFIFSNFLNSSDFWVSYQLYSCKNLQNWRQATWIHFSASSSRSFTL